MRRRRQGQLDLAGLSYEELAFHLEVSTSHRAFAGLFRGQNPSASILQGNIQALSAEINSILFKLTPMRLPGRCFASLNLTNQTIALRRGVLGSNVGLMGFGARFLG
jgi:hypothetical protein